MHVHAHAYTHAHTCCSHSKVESYGSFVALVLGTSETDARRAAKAVTIEYADGESADGESADGESADGDWIECSALPVCPGSGLNPIQAAEAETAAADGKMEGDLLRAVAGTMVKGTVSHGGQKHFYMETQAHVDAKHVYTHTCAHVHAQTYTQVYPHAHGHFYAHMCIDMSIGMWSDMCV